MMLVGSPLNPICIRCSPNSLIPVSEIWLALDCLPIEFFNSCWDHLTWGTTSSAILTSLSLPPNYHDIFFHLHGLLWIEILGVFIVTLNEHVAKKQLWTVTQFYCLSNIVGIFLTLCLDYYGMYRLAGTVQHGDYLAGRVLHSWCLSRLENNYLNMTRGFLCISTLTSSSKLRLKELYNFLLVGSHHSETILIFCLLHPKQTNLFVPHTGYKKTESKQADK